jgi:hypothetical protein
MKNIIVAAAFAIVATNATASNFSDSVACRKLVLSAHPQTETRFVESHLSSKNGTCFARITYTLPAGGKYESRESLYNAVDNTLLAIASTGQDAISIGHIFVPGQETHDGDKAQAFIDNAMHE